MNDDDLLNLSKVWQAKTPENQIDTTSFKRRYLRQKVFIAFNVLVEALLTAAVAYLFAQSFFSDSSTLQILWLGFATLWAMSTFILVNRSRLISFNILLERTVKDSLNHQVALLQQDIVRCNIGTIATLVFSLAMMVYFIVLNLYQQGAQDIWPPVLSTALLVCALIFFSLRKRRAKRLIAHLNS